MFVVAYFTLTAPVSGFPLGVMTATVGFGTFHTPDSDTLAVAAVKTNVGSSSAIVMVLIFWLPSFAPAGADRVILNVSAGSTTASCRIVGRMSWVLPLGDPAPNVRNPDALV